jgi:hypothetical protein
MKTSSAFSAGDWVQVRSKDEILQTLDERSQLEALPFMPEMLQYCGRRFQVFRRAHKTCDPPNNGMESRKMMHAVHLEALRCDGAAHGGCQAGCLLFWKDEWLQPVSGPGDQPPRPTPSLPGLASSTAAEADVYKGTRASAAEFDSPDPVYVCQSTQLDAATSQLHWWDLRQYVEDYTSGNVRLTQLASALGFFVYSTVTAAGIGLGSALTWIYDAVHQRLRRRHPYPLRTGRVRKGTITPAERLDLQPGELVTIRSYEEILATLDQNSHNRGMLFDPEMVPYCEGTYRVLQRVTQIINERTGKMQQLKNDCIQLDGVVCKACYAKHRRFCPRSIYPYWREIWLRRVRRADYSETLPA